MDYRTDVPSASDILIAAAVGAGASLVANAIWSHVTAPKLAVADPRETSVEGDAHFWGAPVEMAEPVVFPRRPALAVHANLEIRDPSSGEEVAHFVCRWQGTPQPVVPTGSNVYVGSIPLIPVGQRDDIFQHKPGAVDLFIKFDGEDAFYGFPNEAYFHGLRHKDFKFIQARYYARLFVRHDRDEHMLDIEIRNPSKRAADFSVSVRDRRHRSTLGGESSVWAT